MKTEPNTPPLPSKNLIPAKAIWRLMREAAGGRPIAREAVEVVSQAVERFIIDTAKRAVILQDSRNTTRTEQNIPIEKRISGALLKEVLNL